MNKGSTIETDQILRMQTFNNRCNSISFQNWFTAALPKHFHLAFALQCIDTNWLILPSLIYTQCWLTKRTQVKEKGGKFTQNSGTERKNKTGNHRKTTAYRLRKLLWYYFTKNGQVIRGMPSSSTPLMKWFPGWSSEWGARGEGLGLFWLGSTFKRTSHRRESR